MKKQKKQIKDDGYIVITKEVRNVKLIEPPHLIIDVTLKDLMCLYRDSLAKRLRIQAYNPEATGAFMHLTKKISFFVTWPKRNTKNKKRGRK